MKLMGSLSSFRGIFKNETTSVNAKRSREGLPPLHFDNILCQVTTDILNDGMLTPLRYLLKFFFSPVRKCDIREMEEDAPALAKLNPYVSNGLLYLKHFMIRSCFPNEHIKTYLEEMPLQKLGQIRDEVQHTFFRGYDHFLG